MVRACGEKDRGRCSNENMKDEYEWTAKDRKTKTERCHTKRHERVKRKESQDRRAWKRLHFS